MKTLLAALLVVTSFALPALQSPTSPISQNSQISQISQPSQSAPTQPQQPAAMIQKQKITPFLWFDQNAEEAVRFYTAIFKDSKVLSEARWGEGGPVPKGTLMTSKFQLAGQEFMALNGGPQFHFTEAISLMIPCESQQEIDTLWERLIAGGGSPGQCGWLKDKFGLSWQVVPATLGELLNDKDPAKAARVGAAMLKMHKIDLATLLKARDGK